MTSRCLQLVVVLGVVAAGQAATTRAEPTGVSEKSSKRIAAVVSTLEDILASVQGEEVNEQKSYSDFMAWCSQELSTTKLALDDSNLQSEESQATVQELTATVTQLTQVLSDSAVEREDAKDTIASATAVREKDGEKAAQDISMNGQSIGSIAQAINILGNVHGEGDATGFLQANKRTRRSNEPGESSAIFGIMKGLKERLEETHSALLNAESQAANEHGSFLSTQKDRVTGLTDTISVKQQEDTTAKVDLVTAERLSTRLQAQIQDLSAILSEVTKQCIEKKQWWETRQADRQQEKQALQEAIKFIEDAAPEKAEPQGDQDDEDEDGDDATSFVQILAHITKKFSVQRSAMLGAATAQLAAMAVSSSGSAEARKGALESAKTVVEQLIDVLQKEHSDETTKKKYCEAEIEKKDGEQASVLAEIERLNASIERKTSEAEMLTAEVDIIEKELDTMEASLNNATGIRKAEKAVYEAGTKDRTLAVKVLVQAKEVLKKFYESKEKTSLMQAKAKQPEIAKSSRKSLSSQAVVDRLDMVVSDINKEQHDATSQENAASAAFVKLQGDCRDEFDEQMQAITQRKKVKARTLVRLGADKEAHGQKEEDHGAVSTQLVSLHGQCDELLQNFDKRVDTRNFEVSQLRDVVDILSGSSIAARTGLLEEDSKTQPDASSAADETSGMDAKELSLLKDLTRAAGQIAS